jgi:uncharacterized membrane protein
MLIGFSLGRWFKPNVEPSKRKKWLLQTGVACVVSFVILRLLNVYGDPAPWSSQKDTWFTFLSFLNTSKYPVSLLFMLMTIGPLLILLSYFENREVKVSNPFLIFGRVPLFYFIVHFFLIHSLALIFFINKTGKSFSEIDLHFSKSFGGITPEGGYSLPWVYVAWTGVVLLMYPLCRWYNHYKNRHTDAWLSYL